ncbi:MAG: hypothetical protein L0Z50_38080 [Verrucomicrobiales bacterium]|nr:hypothetical protein [Verrucomicrobiales bacterium]
MKYVISYAYNLPHYADFVVEARNKKEALRKAKQGLQQGRFKEIQGQPNDTVEGERVFVLKPADKDDEALEHI